MTKTTLAEHENKCKFSCTIYVALIAIIFTINIGIGTYFYLLQIHESWQKKLLLDMIMFIKQKIIDINGASQKNKH